MKALKNTGIGIVLLFSFAMPVNSLAQGRKHYRFYNKYGRSKSDRLTPSFNLSVNTGILFPEILGVSHAIYKQKEYNFTYGLSLEKKVFHYFGLRVDAAKGKLSANNFKSAPALTDHNSAYYRNYTTDIEYMVGGSIVFSMPLLTEREFRDKPVSLSVWAGGGLMHFESSFYHYPKEFVYYSKLYGTYKNVGVAVKYRPIQNIDLGLNYVLHFYDGYNVDAVQVHGGVHKDRFSSAYISLNFLILHR